MTFKSNNEIQQGIVAYLKSKATIIAELDSANEIKEDQWQGTLAKYPGVRVRMISDRPYADCASDFIVSIMVFSEDASSQEADRIAGIIANILLGRGFSSSGVAFAVWTTNLVPAIRQDTRTWRSEILITGRAS